MGRMGTGLVAVVATWLVGCEGSDDLRRVDCPDADGDGRCDQDDLCFGDDQFGDEDFDGVCDDRDVCPTGRDDDDVDGDGVPAVCDDCPDTPAGAEVNEVGCPPIDTDAPETDAPDTDAADTDQPPEPGDLRTHPVLGPLRHIPAGSFTMGCVEDRDDVAGHDCAIGTALPTRQVTLTSALWMMETELTQDIWTSELLYTNPSGFTGGSRPVESVTWWEALHAANAVSAKDGLEACYTFTGCNSSDVGEERVCTNVQVSAPSGEPKDCEGWRLPTEAEWEFAARAQTDLPYAGGSDVDQVSWSKNNSGMETKASCTSPTPRNAWGLCDMSGNVREWIWDWYVSGYTGAAALDPTGPAISTYRSVRGGSYFDEPRFLRVGARGNRQPQDALTVLGFRLVRSAD